MSKTVDERVVSMQFDNKKFESNVSTTMSTLDKLKQKLNLNGASKGLENIDAASKKVNMSGLGSSVEAVSSRFSALEVMGVTALANITNSAVNAGKRIVSALTIDPIKTGFDEYETKINAVQTIMSNTASKGTTMSDVTATLDDLNTYADKTIYNFAEMTRNIGTFTAAGVGLEESASAIKGIANLAAASGSNSQQASTAMYQLSQALAAGTVKLMDWNSVVNAGMGGEKFQEALKATAREHGIAVDQMVKDAGSFRESLSKGWITADILNETLSKFTVEGATEYAKAMRESGKWTKEQADALIKEAQAMEDAATKVKTFTQLWDTMKESAQSGWAQTWELIFGDFEEAKGFFSSLSDMFGEAIGGSADRRNKILGDALNSKYDDFIAKVNEAGVATEDFNNLLIESASDHGVKIEKLIDEHGSLNNVIAKGLIPTKAFTDALDKCSTSSKESAEALKKAKQYIVQDGDYLIKIADKYGMTWQELYELNRDIIDDPNLIYTDQVLKLSDAQLENIGYTKKQIKVIRDLATEAKKTGTPINKLVEAMGKPSGRQMLFESLKNSIAAVLQVMNAIGDAWYKVFPAEDTSKGIYNLIEAIYNFSTKLKMSKSTVKDLTNTFKGLFAILDIITTITGGAFKVVFKTICKLLGLADVNILSVTGSIGDAIVKFRDWLFENNAVVKGLEKFIDYIGKGINKIKEWIKRFKELPIVQKNISNIKEAATDTFENLNKHFSNGIEVFSEFINRVKEMDKLSLDNIKLALKDFWENVVKYFADVGDSFKSVGDAITKFKDDIKKNFEESGRNFDGFKEKVANVITFIKEKISSINLGSIFTIAIGAGFIYLIKKISDGVKSLFGVFDGIGDVVSGFAKGILGVGKVLRSLAFSIKAKALINIALAILILVGAIAVLTLLDTNKLWSAVGVLSAVSLMLIGITTALSFVGKDAVSLFAGAAVMTSIGIALAIFVGCLKALSGMSESALTKGLVAIAAIESLIIALIAISKLAGAADQIHAIGPMIKKIAVSLLLMTLVMKIVAGMSAEDVAKGIITIVALEAMIVALIAASKLAGNWKRTEVLGKMIQQIAVSLLLLTIVMKIVAGMSPEDVVKGIVVIAALEAMIIALMSASRLAGNWKRTASIGKMIQQIGVALLLMAVTMRIIAGLSPEDVFKGILVIAALEALMIALIAVSKLSGKHAAKAGTMIMQIGVAFLLLAAAMAIISLIKPEGLKQAILAIGALSACFAALIAVSGIAKNAKKTIIALSIAIAVLAIALAGLSTIEPKNLLAASLALSMVMGVFAALISATQFINTQKGSLLKVIVTLGVMTLVVAALAFVISKLADINAENSIVNATALSELVLALSKACVILSKTGASITKALLPALAMAGIVAVLGAILLAMDALNVGPTLEIATSLSILLLALSGACLILSKVGVIGAAASSGAASLLGLLGIVSAIILAVGGIIAAIPGSPAFLDTLITVLEKLGYALGAFFGNIVGGFMSGMTSGLPKMAEDLSAFMMKLTPFIIGAKMIDPEMLQGVKSLAEVILVLTAANLLDRIASFGMGGKSLAEFSEQLIPFGNAMVRFSSIIKGNVDEDAVMAAANAGKLMAEMAKTIPNSGGVVGFFAGENDMDEFGRQLMPFGRAISKFSNTVKGNVDEESVVAAANAGKAMSEMASTIPNSGGVVSFFTGENDMDEFGKQLIPFGKAIVSFSDIVKGNIDEDAVLAAANAGKAMSEMASTIPNSGGVVSFFTGDNNMDEFGNQLIPFGRAMVSFSSTVAGNIDSDAVLAAANAGKIMAEMASTIPNSGGVVGFFVGNNDMDDFGNQLIPFGRAMVTFSDTVKGKIDPTSVMAAVISGKIMAELASTVPNSGGLVSFFTGDNDLGMFATQIVLFGSGMAAFSSIVKGNIHTKSVTAAANAGKIMLNLQSMISDENSIWDFFTTRYDMATFKTQLVLFGEAIVAFSSEVDGNLNEHAIKVAADVGLAIIKMAKTLPKDMDLSKIDDGLSSLAESLIDFSEALNGQVDFDSVDSAVDVGDKIVRMSNKITKETDLASAITGLESFGEGLVKFSDIVGVGIDNEAILKATTAGTEIVDMVNTINTEADLTNIGSGLGTIASGIADFSEKVEGVNLFSVSSGVMAGKSIAGFINKIPQNIDTTVFLNNVAALGNRIKTFSENSQGINLYMVMNAVYAGNMISNFLSGIPQNIDVSIFLNNVQALANRIKTFSENSQGINLMSIMNTVYAGNMISNFLSGIPQDIDVSVYLNSVAALGSRIKDFSDNCKGVNTIYVEWAVIAGNMISGFIKGIPQNTDVSVYINNVAALGSRIKDFSNYAKDVDYGAVSTATSSGDLINSMLENTPSSTKMSGFSTNIPKVGEAIADFTSDVADITASDLTNLANGFSEMVTKFNEMGKKGIKGFIEAFTDSTTKVQNAVKMIANASVTALDKNGKYYAFYNVGSYLVAGFAAGISANTWKAEAKAAAMANAAERAAKNALDEHSPSKKFYKIGVFAGIALVNALGDYESKSYTAGAAVANAATKGLSGAISKISDTINSDMDAQPTIRPVLDLSDIESGAGRINGMLNMNPSVGVLSNVRTISSMMNRNQNGSNNDVISAIKDLGRRIGNTSGDTYQINGITYDDGSNVSDAVRTLVRAARVERRK